MAHYRSVRFEPPEAQLLADLSGVDLDLRATERLVDRFLKERAEETLDCELLEAICAAALVRYGRTFPCGVRRGVSVQALQKLPEELQDAHQYFKDLRDKWVAHSVNDFEENEVTVSLMPTDRGPMGVTGVNVRQHRVMSLSAETLEILRKLCIALRAILKEDIANEKASVLRIARALPPESFYEQHDRAVRVGVKAPEQPRPRK